MTPTPHLSFGLLLTAAAGFADVVGFIELGGHFVSFMSGNTTQLGDALLQSNWTAIILPASLIALFFIGSTLGALAAIAAGPRWAAATTTAIVLASLAMTVVLAAFGAPPDQFMLMLAAGAGAQNAILPSTGSVRLGITFVTGTLFAAGQDLARAMRGLAPPWRWAQHLLVWASLLVGAIVGGLAYSFVGIYALLLPAALYLAFLIAFVVEPPSSVAL
ncbi:YoaK family protein [Devosia sp. 2618]|uniref:YoaK family protein n=1 Tax=Devosia sp. 2618 TaxID=3156454 RepID=UPI0033983A37